MINDKELKIEDVYKQKTHFNEVSLVGDLIFWKDNLNISEEKNNALFVRPIKKDEWIPQKLTGDGFFINSSFHGYGGRSYKCIQSKNKIYIIWIDKLTLSIWLQEYQINNYESYLNNSSYLKSISEPKKLSKELIGNFDANFVLINRKFILGIVEINERDYLYSVDINVCEQDLKILKEFDNFAGSLSSYQGGDFLSWIEWDSPFMPWENNDLFFANLDNNSQIKKIQKFEKTRISNCDNISFFQPYWLSENIFVCSEDSSGWWNLIFLEINQLENIVIKKRIIKKYYEYGMPQWVSGISLFSGTQESFFCLARHEDYWVLETYKNFAFIKRIDLPFTNFSDLHVSGNKLIFKASSNNSQKQLMELEIDDLSNLSSKNYFINISVSTSNAETFWFEGYKKKRTHAFIYNSKLFNTKKLPLIVKAHSGPTNYFNGELNNEVNFWTSRGWLVAEVNYGGSSCFGKDYRDRLNGNWGIVDSEDCKALVRILIKKGLVDESKIVIFGNSAGGFTALNALCSDPLFKAAICKYPVIDLNQMHFNTHRFEKNYLNSLIGQFNTNKKTYFERSPINKVKHIFQPVLLFHGKEDYVIDYKISLQFNKELLKNKTHSEIYLFENEGHGIKSLNNKLKYLQISELFLNKNLP